MRILRTSLLIIISSLMILFSILPTQAESSWQRPHVVQPGETLFLIALQYGVDVNELAKLNGISNAHLIHSWQQLTIPSNSSTAAPAQPVRGNHIVQRGETLDSIAKFYDITISELRTLNNIYGHYIYPGEELALPVPGRAPISEPGQPAVSANGNTHIVQYGDTLGTIAALYGVNLLELQAANNIWSYIIYPGQQLLIPSAGPVVQQKPSSSTSATEQPAPVIQPKTHIVQRGETLFRIARQYDISLEALMRANVITDPTRIHAGLELRVSHLDQVPAATVTSGSPVTDTEREQYVVQPGDYLSQIGARWGMSWLAIAEVNGMSAPYALKAGDMLLIPSPDEAAKYGPVSNFYASSNHPGARIGSGRELVVILSSQAAYAYEDGILQKRALISSGLPTTPTVQGNFAIKRKVRSQTMTGPGYSWDNVEWVMYFYESYAFHGAYWHYNFGQPMSYGCLNMTNTDAKWFYEFADIGTPVHVRYDY